MFEIILLLKLLNKFIVLILFNEISLLDNMAKLKEIVDEIFDNIEFLIFK